MTPPVYNLCQLDRLPAGTEFIVRRILGGWRARQRLAEIGLIPGAHARILEHHPLIVCVGDTCVALGRGIRGQVEVEPVVPDQQAEQQA